MPLGLFENDVFNVFATCVPAVKLNFFRMELLNLLINCYTYTLYSILNSQKVLYHPTLNKIANMSKFGEMSKIDL